MPTTSTGQVYCYDADETLAALGRATTGTQIGPSEREEARQTVEAFLRWSGKRLKKYGELHNAHSIANSALNRRCQLAESKAHRAESALAAYEMWFKHYSDRLAAQIDAEGRDSQ